MMLLLDGDILIYKACASAEKEVEWEPDLFSLWTNLSDAKDNLITAYDSLVARAKQHAEIDRVVFCVTDRKQNWRKDVYPLYKANRSGRKPLGYAALREWADQYYNSTFKPRLEADDCIGILATKPGNDCLIWSEDKDLKQIPGQHLGPDGLVTVSTYDADRYHFIQSLTGDATDGYPGCRGIGPVKAEKILDSKLARETSYWPAVLHAYVEAGFSEEYALAQARVARICRWEDWDQEKQEVKLWTPM